MAKASLAFLLLLLVHASFAQISLIASNATYGEAIYILATKNGTLASGIAYAISPSGRSSTLYLENGQAKFNATELGEWKISFANETALAYAYEKKPPAQPEPMPAGDNFWAAILIALILAVGITAASFLLHDFLHPQYSVRKSFDGRWAHAEITALRSDLRDVKILVGGQQIATRPVLRKGTTLSASLECESEPEMEFEVGSRREAQEPAHPRDAGAAIPKAKRALPRADS